MNKIKPWLCQILLFDEPATASCLCSSMADENRLQERRERERERERSKRAFETAEEMELRLERLSTSDR